MNKEANYNQVYQTGTPFPRVEHLLSRFFTIKPQVCIERAQIYTNVYKQTEGEPEILRRGKAFYTVCKEKSIFIADGELIVGCAASTPRAGIFCPEHANQWLREELDTLSSRKQDPYEVTQDQKDILVNEIFPYWETNNISSKWLSQIPDEVKEIAVQTGIIDIEIKTQSGPGEISPNLKRVLSEGFSGIRRQVVCCMDSLDSAIPKEHEKIIFYKAVLYTIDGIILLANRYANLAYDMAQKEKNSIRREELKTISAVLKRVPEHPPENFREALQAFWIMQIGCYIEANGPSYSPGRVDQIFYPFYKQDIKKGVLDSDEALELIECLYLKFAENTWFLSKNAAMYFAGYQPYQNICVGGITRDGLDATNELSYMFIQAKMDVRLHSPSLSVRVHKQSPIQFLNAVAGLSQIGTGFPAIHNDETTIKMMLLSGASIEDARDYCLVGCVEPYIPGKMSKWTDGGHYNYASAVEFALTNGVSLMNDNRTLGLKTGDPTEMSFEEFKTAIKKQLAYFIRNIATACHICEKLHAEYTQYPYMSSMIEGCIESGRDITGGGALLTVGAAFIGTGIADLANSLAAIKQSVYEDHIISMDQLVMAIKDNFKGHESLRAYLEKNGHYYGNDDDYVDGFAREFTDFAMHEIISYSSYRGPHYISGLYPVASHVPHGEIVSALPYGRLSGTPLADGCSPKGGTDLHGPTAVLKSVSKLNHEAHTAGTLLNMRLDPATIQGEKGIERLVALIKTFLDLDIYHIQFNIISSNTLKKAQAEPQKYKSLIVRVAGYSAFFVELCPEMQNDIIQRTVQRY